MKKVRLTDLKGNNFQGLKNFESTFSGDTTITGGNEQGKTTLRALFNWVLFGKNENFETKFDFKPLDKEGKVIHNLEILGEIVFDVDGASKEFKRVLKENWTKTRGTKELKLEGNSTEYFYNSESVKQKIYKEKLSEIILESDFMKLTSINYFFDEKRFPWTERRKYLIQKSGAVNFSEFLLTKGFIELAGKISETGYDAYVSSNNKKAKKHKDEAKSLRTRIDENARSINSDIQKPEGQLKEIENVNTKIKDLQSSKVKQINAKNTKSNDQQIVVNDLDNKHTQVSYNITRVKKEISETENLIKSAENVIVENNKKLASIDQEKAKAEVKKQALKNTKEPLVLEYKRIKAEKFIFKGSGDCQTCSQPLPPEMLQKAEELEKKAFDSRNKLLLTNLESKGKSINLKIKNIDLTLDDPATLLSSSENWHAEIAKHKKELEAFNKKESELVAEQTTLKEDITTAGLKLELIESEDVIDNTEAIEKLQESLVVLNVAIASYNESEKALNRSKELEESLRKEEGNQVEFEILVDEIKEYFKSYIELVTSKINALFESGSIKIQMFEDQLNGGYREGCQVLVKNDLDIFVPYSSANTAAQISTGIEVNNMFCKDLDISLPIFVDNCESIEERRIPESQNQLIKLSMVPYQKGLKII